MKTVFIINQQHLKAPLAEYGIKAIVFNHERSVIAALNKLDTEKKTFPTAILCEFEMSGFYKDLISFTKTLSKRVPVIVIARTMDPLAKEQAYRNGATDYFTYGLDLDRLAYRISSLENLQKNARQKPKVITYRTPVLKRGLDITVALLCLIISLPLSIITALLIKILYDGPVIESSWRVGTGYNIFPLYTFRLPTVKRKEKTKSANTPVPKKLNVPVNSLDYDKVLVGDDGYAIEEQNLSHPPAPSRYEKVEKVKLTWFGKVLKKSKIRSIPEFYNVLIGDISLVGNKPLPIDLAERLTSDQWSIRFLTPAGLTGTWRVNYSKLSETEKMKRVPLDVLYTKKYSLWTDLKILMMSPFHLKHG